MDCESVASPLPKVQEWSPPLEAHWLKLRFPLGSAIKSANGQVLQVVGRALQDLLERALVSGSAVAVCLTKWAAWSSVGSRGLQARSWGRDSEGTACTALERFYQIE